MNKKEEARTVLNEATKNSPRVAKTLRDVIEKESQVPVEVTDPEVAALRDIINNADSEEAALQQAITSLLKLIRTPDAPGRAP